MGFTRSTTTTNVHSTLGDYPNVDDGITASELKARFDAPATGLKGDINQLETEMEASTAAANLGAAAIGDGDSSNANIQAKLLKIYTELLAIKAGGIDSGGVKTASINDGAVTTAKIADNNVTTGKLAASAVTTAKIADGNVTNAKLEDGTITSAKLATNTKKAENLTATAMTEADTSDGNIQAKLNKLAQDMIDITQGQVADDSITAAKIASNAVTTDKVNNGAVTADKIAANAVNNSKVASGFGLVPSGVICMWSGAVNAIPTGWVLCDGTNSTPDLRNRFIVGAGSTYSVGNTGGEASHKLTTSEMPGHTHSGTTGNESAAHSHNFLAYSGSSTGFAQPALEPTADSGYIRATSVRCKRSSTANMIADNSTSHTHDFTTNSTGSGIAHENRPPYYALAYIMKT